MHIWVGVCSCMRNRPEIERLEHVARYWLSEDERGELARWMLGQAAKASDGAAWVGLGGLGSRVVAVRDRR